ncbi:MAG: hypothetical protein ABSA57_07950 [Candidatus Acidiferrales bacterium]|jgi:hypothetical protein
MRFTLFLCSWMLLQSAPALAQHSLPACDGRVAIVRVSEIKPGGMEGFLAAVKAHKAWYRNNGVTSNEILVSRVIVKDEKTGEWKYSDSEVITYHINPPEDNAKLPRNDDAWKAYVKMYNDVSTVKSITLSCMPKMN